MQSNKQTTEVSRRTSQYAGTIVIGKSDKGVRDVAGQEGDLRF